VPVLLATLPPTRPPGKVRPRDQIDRWSFEEDWGSRMRRLLPSRVEIAIFATLAVLCAACVALFQPNTHDLGFAALAAPIFLIAACMGLRRSPAWTMTSDDEADQV
jgi:hypothetical protein